METYLKQSTMASSPSKSSSSSSSTTEDSSSELRRGPWTAEEDNLLVHYISQHGEGRWNLLAKCSGLRRTGKSCRLRWLNYLKPDVKRGNLSPEEQLLILELHTKWGNRWSRIAQFLPGRTDNEIKNYWRTRVQKQARHLKIDSNSAAFHQLIRGLWMPRLIQKIQSTSSSSSSPPVSALNSSTNQHYRFINTQSPPLSACSLMDSGQGNVNLDPSSESSVMKHGEHVKVSEDDVTDEFDDYCRFGDVIFDGFSPSPFSETGEFKDDVISSDYLQHGNCSLIDDFLDDSLWSMDNNNNLL